jgi:hypothetical protein
MLGKLMKYDFKALAKMLFPVYGVMIALMFVVSLMAKLNLENNALFVILALLLGFLIAASFTVTIICVVLRFYNGLLKNEGYLSFSLPVKTETHIAAKVINAVIWAIMEIFALMICVIIYAFTVANLKDIAYAIEALFGLDFNFYLSVFQILFLLAAELICAVCLCFAALSIAHLFDKHQKLIAGIFIVLMVIVRSVLIPTRFYVNMSTVNDVIVIAPQWYLIPLCLSVAYAILTWYILDKKLNLQ